MGYRILIAAAVGAHFAFLAFGIFGGFLAWRWPKLLWLQVLSATWLLVIVVAGLSCPLTWLEDRGREGAGLPALNGGFLDTHVAGVFYPHGYEWVARIVVAVVILTSWAGLVVRSRSRSRSRSELGDRVG
ncbi:DUF2784 domain-containing protein [Actinoplanes friuliensis]|uniref:DUF2784 domain-containing protein n=1 Tax=Actinoplanes friuliensis DSM 7358 TaxID=1246995 RepID=U5W8S8_9ACTN|nr:DUF2784 domain-containing protein [Actinoplanes friuliensis]AGZ45422.1 hypothetical protein AFR_35830 [Actinoplanes friuliensis DSM 7358]